MSGLSIKHIFGISSSLSNSVYYLNEHCYIYPSSRHLILYNIDYQNEDLIPYGNEFDKLEFFSLSRNKEYLGIVLNNLDKCRLVIYDLNETINLAIERKKTIPFKETIRSNHLLSMTFSNNCKYLLGLLLVKNCSVKQRIFL